MGDITNNDWNEIMADQQKIELDAALNDFHEQIKQGIWSEDKIDEIIKIANRDPGWESKVKDFEAYCDQLYANFNNDKDAGSSQNITGNFGLINFRELAVKLPSKPDVNTENVSSHTIFSREVLKETKSKPNSSLFDRSIESKVKESSSVNCLTLDTDNATIQKKVQLIKIECKSFENFMEQLSTIIWDCFPNCVVIESVCEFPRKSRVIEELNNIKFKNNISYINFKARPFLIVFENGKVFKQRDDVFKIPRDTGIECIEKFCSKVKYISDLNIDLLGNDFRKLTLDSIEKHDELCFKILHIFDHQKDQEDIYKNIVKSRNFELFKFYRKEMPKNATKDSNEAINLTEDEFHNFYAQAWKKVKNIFESAISANEEKVLIFLLHFSQEQYYLNINEKLNNEDENINIPNRKKERKYIKDLESAKLFVKDYPQHEFFKSDLSPLDTAISLQNYEAIALLYFKSKNKSETLNKIKSLCRHANKKVLNEHVKLIDCRLEGTYIERIILKLFQFHDESELIKSKFQKMLNHLDTIDDIRPLLKIAALMDIKLIIESQNESTERVNFNNSNGREKGVTYHKENLIIIAKDLKNEDTIKELYGTFTHEIFHQILYCMYENDAKPFCKEDKDRKEQWENLRDNLQKNVESQVEIVKLALQCGADIDKELAVRYVHLVAHPSLAELEQNDGFIRLREFHREHVLKDMNENLYRTIKLNNHFGVINKIINSKLDIDKSNEISNAIKEEENFYIRSNVPFLALLQLYNEVANKLSDDRLPKIELHGKNIFVSFQSLCKFENQKNLEELLKRSEKEKNVSRVIVTFDAYEHSYHSKNKLEQVLDFLNCIHVQIVLIVSRVFSKTYSSKLKKFEGVDADYTWQKLMQSTKDVISERTITFRNNSKYTMKEIFSLQSNSSSPNEKIIPSDALNFIFNCDDPKIDPAEPELLDFNFISRKVLKKLDDSKPVVKTLKEFINEAEKDKIVVISDLAGSGKTTFLQKIHQSLNEKFQNFWICFVSLLKNKDVLDDENDIGENFLNLIADTILKLNELEKKIFELKYKNNEVVILFDGFDEISPDCKRNAIKIFKLHKQSEKSQIWITTRTHLEKDLEQEVQVEAHKIKPLNEDEQIEFLCKFWEESCDDSNLREKCAKILVEKVSKMNQWRASLIGITLQIQILGEYFEDKLSNDFDEKIKNLNFFQIYEFLIKKSVKFKEEKNSLHNTLKLNIDRYEALALKFCFGPYHHLFGLRALIKSLSDEVLEELTRGGIIFYDKDKKVFFTHLTYGEFLLSKFVKNQIKNFKENWEYEKDFFKLILEILIKGKFEVVKMFLDDAFKDQWKVFKTENLSNLSEGEKNFYSNFNKFIREEKNLELYVKSLDFGLSSFSFSFLKFLKFRNKKMFEKVLEICGKEDHENPELSKNDFLREVVRWTKNSEILEEFIGDFFELYPENEKLFNFLSLKNRDIECETIFGKIARYSPKTFEIFWTKIEERKFEYEEIKTFFLAHERWDENLLESALSASRDEESDEKINTAIEIIERNLKVEDRQKLLTKEAFNKIGCLKFEQPFLRVLKFLHEICSPEKLLEVLSWTWHKAAWYSTREVLKIIFEEILKLSQGNEEKVKEIVLGKHKYGQNVLMRAAWNVFHSESFFYILDEIFLKFLALTFEEFIFEVDDFGRNVLLHLACNGRPDTVENFLNRLEIELSDEKLKNYLASKTEYRENVFHLLTMRWIWSDDTNDRLKVFKDFYLKIFTEEEMKKILTENNEKERTPLHKAAGEKYKDIFKPMLELYESLFTKEEILKLLAMKDKKGKNVFDIASEDEEVKEIIKKYL